MSDEWKLQKALLESHPTDGVQLRVEWHDPNSYTAILEDFGKPVRALDGNISTILIGEGSTAEGAISALFNNASGKTVALSQDGTLAKAKWVFHPERGYRPA